MFQFVFITLMILSLKFVMIFTRYVGDVSIIKKRNSIGEDGATELAALSELSIVL